jgi:hypothetical protein
MLAGHVPARFIVSSAAALSAPARKSIKRAIALIPNGDCWREINGFFVASHLHRPAKRRRTT